MKLIKVGIIWANINSTNLGVSALVYSSLVIFEEIAKRCNVVFEYLLWGTEKQKHSISISGEKIQIKGVPCFLGGDKIRYIKNLIRRPNELLNFRYIKDLKNCDILVDTGAGDSYADIYGIERFRNFEFIKSIFHKSKHPYILLPQTIGPFITNEAESKAKISLTKATMVIARDVQSYDFCHKLGVRSNLVKSIDMAFFLPYDKENLPKSGKIKLGFNISGLLWEGGYTKKNQFELKENYKDVITKILEDLYSSSQYEIHLIGHVNGQEEIDDDWHIIKMIKGKYPNCILAPKFTSPVDAKTYISGLDCFIGARMHACIAAISSGVPVLPMAYSRKFNGLFVSTLKYPYLIDLKEDNKNDVFIKVEEFLKNREAIKSLISVIQESIIDIEKEKLISLIQSVIGKCLMFPK